MSSIPDIAYTIAVWAAPILFAITLHEAAHGWVANKLGDPTAKKLGRITINPIKHIDPVGTIVVPLFLATVSPFVMGWAKPVPVQPQYFKSPMLDMALVAVAGPASNFIMACIWAMFIQLSVMTLDQSQVLTFLVKMGENGIIINIVLMVLNLLPIPPLDGGRVLAGLLPPKLALPYMQLERFGMVIILLLLVSGILGKILWPMVQHFVKMVGYIFGL
ncbi:FIG004556: membrane metalloprotease [hydrothermal vent metagenome]|uniref:FIG004556: membrane metalloprotease n=1 Tax=hydrothermal vent metagenome TaxID=652676 RepID=A0A3B0XET8_9ZZZZ